jgi:ribose transport system permease protein
MSVKEDLVKLTLLSRSVFRSSYFAIWPATFLLFALSPFIAHGSVGLGAFRSTLTFAAILAIASVGQTLVIQQRGLDFSIPSGVSIAAIIVCKVPHGSDAKLVSGIIIALATCALMGLLSGLAITVLRITPLVATLGVNSLALGTIYRITSGTQTASATPGLVKFAQSRIFGISTIFLLTILVILVASFILKYTTIGRRFILIGTSHIAAKAAGLAVKRTQLLTYVIAALYSGFAGILLAGFVQTPGLSVGNNYLLPSIAAVVLGGTSLLGGGGSVVASGIGALFLTQLQQVVFGAGAPASVQLLLQSVAIGVGMGLRTVHWKNFFSTARPRQWATHSG